MIKKVRIKGKVRYRVVSKRTGRNMGTYMTLTGAKMRLSQIEYFKRQGVKSYKKGYFERHSK